MVVFTCGHCGESVQKPKVEKHYMTKCRNNNPNLSCMDCFKDFYGNDYEAHTKCITEAQRYSGKGFVAKQPVGEQKQNTWVEMIKDVISENPNAPKSVIKIIETVSQHSNTPRKKPKFINFVQNVCRSKPHDVDAAWDLISVKLTALAALRSEQNSAKKVEKAESAQTTNGHDAENNKEENVSIAEENSETNNGTALSKKQKQEKKKKAVEQDNEVTIETNNEIIDDKNENVEVITNGTETIPDYNNEKKLSKKERKELKKQKKYEAELESINQATKMEIDPNEEHDQTVSKKKKKKNKVEIENGIEPENKESKKRKLTNESENADDNDATKKKKKFEEDSELDASHIVLNQTVEIQEKKDSTKFNWHEIIITLLKSKDNEMSMKKLQKKVLAEYVTVTGEEANDRIAEKLLKKIKSASNVRIEKNKVVLTA